MSNAHLYTMTEGIQNIFLQAFLYSFLVYSNQQVSQYLLTRVP